MRDELESWLARKLDRGGLIGLPLYRADQASIGRRPEAYARELLAALRGEAASPIDAKGLLREARAFRAWVESRPRSVAWTRRSRIDLDEPEFESLRGRDEIHRYLEAIAHPDPNGPGFVVTPPLSREERLARRRAALAALGITPVRAPSPRVAVLLFLVLNAMFLAIGIVASGLGRAGTPIQMATALAVVIMVLSVMVCVAPVLIAGLLRGLSARRVKASAERRPLGDPWVDGVPPGPVKKGLTLQ